MRSGGRVRETIWFGGAPFTQTLAAVTSVALVTQLNAAALALRPFTVVRSRGVLLVRSDQTAAGEAYGASYGSAVVSEQASAIGVTAVPTPTVDSNFDLWFIYEFILGRFDFGTAVGFTDVGIERIIDSKAMRKVEDGQDLVGVVEGPSSTAGADGSVIGGFVRHLVKLH